MFDKSKLSGTAPPRKAFSSQPHFGSFADWALNLGDAADWVRAGAVFYKALIAETMPVTIVSPVMVALYVPAAGAC